jgi:ribosomal protein L40E
MLPAGPEGSELKVCQVCRLCGALSALSRAELSVSHLSLTLLTFKKQANSKVICRRIYMKHIIRTIS